MSKRETIDCVKEFHEVYDCVIKTEPDLSDEKVNSLRINLLMEEVKELQEAIENNDVVEVLDALTDIQYVLDGAYLSFGLQTYKETAFTEVHRSNMSKLDENGKPIIRESDGKVLKGPNFTPPDLAKILSLVQNNDTKTQIEEAA